ncbi:radical SAM protein [bacterium]|nr:radical SAM protein [bacterium]
MQLFDFLSRIADMRTILSLAGGTMPGQVVIQYTNACNAACPHCELRAGGGFRRTKISMDDMKRIIDTAAAQGVKALSFTGGEPLLFSNDIIELLACAGRAGIPYLRTGTNGFLFMHHDSEGWRKRIESLADSLAATSLYTFWISVDSAEPEVHEKMRGLPGVIRGIEKALPIFHERGIYPAVNLGINRHIGGWWDEERFRPRAESDPDWFEEYFTRSFSRFYRSVIDLGFTTANACYPMSIQSGGNGLDAVYGASSADLSVRFSGKEKAALFRALSTVIPAFRRYIRIFTPLSCLHVLRLSFETGVPGGFPCPGGTHYFFIDASGVDTYPCGFRGGENLGKFWELNLAKLARTKSCCRACEWECFRDPAELIGPLLDLTRRPYDLLGRFVRDRAYGRLWLRDIMYQAACGFFNGRRAPDYAALARFRNSG